MSYAALVMAFGFGNLAMLGWLAAAAAPLLIHMWSRHRHREAPWAAMQFLLAAMRKNARRLQLQQWLLLAVRMLLIVLVVLAAAEPYAGQNAAGVTGLQTHKVLVIDGSYSMAFRDDDESRFERVKQLAAALVRDSRSADTFTVILMADPARTIVDAGVSDKAKVASQIDALAQPHTRANLAGALTLVQEALAERAEREDSIHWHVHFFTDLQQTTWSENADELAALAENAVVSVVDVGRSPSPNLAVTNFAAAESLATTGREMAFDVTVHQFGQAPRQQCVLELLVDDAAVAEQIVSVPGDGDASVRFTHHFPSPGSYALAVRAAGDHLPVDNTRWLVVPVREEVRVLCVAGRDGAARYVADALNPEPAGNSPIRPVVVSEGELAELEFADFDCVFLCNVAQLTSNEAERLTRYAGAGGGVVFFLGDRVLAENYNAQAPAAAGSQAERGNEALLPARIGEVVAQPQFGLDPRDYQHPVVVPFRGRERSGLLTTPVRRYYRLDLSQSSRSVEVAVATSSGDPFIVTAPLGRGRTVVVATDASLASVDPATGEPWTHWPTWPSFLPIVRELLAFATSGQQQEWQQLVGTPLINRGVASAETSEGPLRILRPDGRLDAVSVQSAGAAWTYGQTNISGIYSLAGVPHSDARRFAVNVDTTESDLAKLPPQELPAELSINDVRQRTSDQVAGGRFAQAAWTIPLLWFALVLLFAEAFLAWFFGRGMA